MGNCFGMFGSSTNHGGNKLFKAKGKHGAKSVVESNCKVNESFSNIWPMTEKKRLSISKGNKLKKWSKSRQCLLDNICNEDLEGTQLLPLDAYTLLASKVFQKRTSFSSTPPSSIDLEWEHEGIACSRARSATLSVEESSNSGCGGASPESLEWDPCVTNTDTETELLIKQIEALTKKALMETGDKTIK